MTFAGMKIESNRSTFGFNLNGIKVQQRKEIFDIFPSFFEKEKFDKVLEVGTHHGGLASWLWELSNKHNFKFKTYDIKDYLKSVREYYGGVPFDFTQIDVRQGSGMEEIINQISESNKKCLVLIDGGAKNKEFNIYAPYLKFNDIIMTHDYAPSIEYFNEHIYKKIWLYLESWDAKLEWEKNNLEKIYPEFQNVVWSCFRRKKI